MVLGCHMVHCSARNILRYGLLGDGVNLSGPKRFGKTVGEHPAVESFCINTRTNTTTVSSTVLSLQKHGLKISTFQLFSNCLIKPTTLPQAVHHTFAGAPA